MSSSQGADSYQMGATASGTQMFINVTTYNSELEIDSVLAFNDILVGTRGVRVGGRIQSTGALFYVPTTRGIEIHDVHRGERILAIGLPKGVAAANDPLAISSDGRRIYVAEPDGVGIIDIGEVPLSLGEVSPHNGLAEAGQTLTALGCGFHPGALVSIDGKRAETRYEDSTRLSFFNPGVSERKVDVTVTNPSGETYTLHRAYDASAIPPNPSPVLQALHLGGETKAWDDVEIEVQGTGFLGGSRILLDATPITTLYRSPTLLYKGARSAWTRHSLDQRPKSRAKGSVQLAVLRSHRPRSFARRISECCLSFHRAGYTRARNNR